MKLFNRKPIYLFETTSWDVKTSMFGIKAKKKTKLHVELSVNNDGKWKSLGAFRYDQIKDVRKCLDEAERFMSRHLREG